VWYVYGFGRFYVFRIAKQLIFTIIGVYSTSRFSLELSQEISVWQIYCFLLGYFNVASVHWGYRQFQTIHMCKTLLKCINMSVYENNVLLHVSYNFMSRFSGTNVHVYWFMFRETSQYIILYHRLVSFIFTIIDSKVYNDR